jgi:hypothetical protein
MSWASGPDLRLQRPDGPVIDEGVDVPLVRCPLAAPLEAEPQEGEALAEAHDDEERPQPQSHPSPGGRRSGPRVNSARPRQSHDSLAGRRWSPVSCRRDGYVQWPVRRMVDTTKPDIAVTQGSDLMGEVGTRPDVREISELAAVIDVKVTSLRHPSRCSCRYTKRPSRRPLGGLRSTPVVLNT